MDVNLENNIIKVMVRDGCSFGHVVRSISREIIYRIKVAGLRFTVLMRHSWGMLDKVFLGLT